MNQKLLGLLIVGASFCFARVSEAKAIHFGLGFGINWAQFAEEVSDSVFLSRSSRPSGFSYAGTFSLTFFQDSLVGIRLAEDFVNIDASGDSGDSFRSKLWMTSGVLALNFDWNNARHAFGFGYGRGLLRGQSATPSELRYDRGYVDALVFEGKDMWKISSNQYIFLSGKIFFLVNSPGPRGMVGAFLLGFDL